MTSIEERDERGVVAIVVALCMTLFIGVLAFTIDFARLRATRADAQAAADNAALAAAWRTCKAVPSSAVAAAEDVASDNGFSDPADVDVVAEGTDGWRVNIDADVDTSFAAALGVSSLDTTVTAKSRANCAPGSTALPSIYAQGSCPGSYNVFKAAGKTNRFTGDVIISQDADFSGNGNTIYGDLKVKRDLKLGDSTTVSEGDSPDTSLVSEAGPPGGHTEYGNTIDGSSKLTTQYGPSQVTYSAPSVPTYAQSTYTAMSHMTTLQYVSGQIKSGLYVLSGKDIILDKSSAPGGITIIATDPEAKITVKGNIELTPFVDSLLIANYHDNDPSCGGQAVYVENDGARLNGVIYAPNAGFYVKGKNNWLIGAAITRWVSVEGDDNHFVAGITGSNPTKFVEILE